MKLHKIAIKNFRILENVSFTLDESTTIIVGRNNSGKTCVTEIFRRLVGDGSSWFALEDFSLGTHVAFWNAYQAKTQAAEDDAVRAILPIIEIGLHFEYADTDPDLGVLSDFIIDLDVDSTEAVAVVRYQLKYGAVDDLFNDMKCANEQDEEAKKSVFFREIKERITNNYTITVTAVDVKDNNNQKAMDLAQLKALIQPGFISAQRGLDDATQKEKDVLGKVLERLLAAASSEEADEHDREIVSSLESAVQGIQQQIDGDFSSKLKELLPTLSIFGYPGLGDPGLQTETILDVKRLLGDNTKIKYATSNGVNLPESYNGLGSRNLIYILLQIHEFFKLYKARPTAPGVHLVFIEEPEAHLHPQMQEVFIRKMREIAKEFETRFNGGNSWPVQFVVTTHSTHIANESRFEAIRYFLSDRTDDIPTTEVKDLRTGLGGADWDADKEFLHKYMTLTKCDLFFADKAIMIEGTTERLLMPKLIEKTDTTLSAGSKNLSSQYVSTIEVGGAHAHRFFNLLKFLELRTLIITDIDSVNATREKCVVVEGTATSNGCIKDWFGDKKITPAQLIAKTKEEKVTDDLRRIAYQIPETGATACGRSFEDAFMLANQQLFGVAGGTDVEKAQDAWTKAKAVDKADFGLEYAINQDDWNVPTYIAEGLSWLAQDIDPAPVAVVEEKVPAKKKK